MDTRLKGRAPYMLPLFSGVSLTSNHIAIVPGVQITGFNATVVSVQLRINCTPKRGVICTTSRLSLERHSKNLWTFGIPKRDGQSRLLMRKSSRRWEKGNNSAEMREYVDVSCTWVTGMWKHRANVYRHLNLGIHYYESRKIKEQLHHLNEIAASISQRVFDMDIGFFLRADSKMGRRAERHFFSIFTIFPNSGKFSRSISKRKEKEWALLELLEHWPAVKIITKRWATC